jgi:four helix bundle suffix protein
MVQAARSGVQNIAEGSLASGTSKKTELKLTNVARASLGELMRDFEDFLRQRNLSQWEKDSSEALAARQRLQSAPSDLLDLRSAPPEIAANTLLCLINQATYLLRRQLERLAHDFLEHGGFTERLHAARSHSRRLSNPSDKSDMSDKSDSLRPPACPHCSKPMRLRTARKGRHSGQQFWGCSAYPDCRGTRPLDPPSEADSAT